MVGFCFVISEGEKQIPSPLGPGIGEHHTQGDKRACMVRKKGFTSVRLEPVLQLCVARLKTCYAYGAGFLVLGFGLCFVNKTNIFFVAVHKRPIHQGSFFSPDLPKFSFCRLFL